LFGAAVHRDGNRNAGDRLVVADLTQRLPRRLEVRGIPALAGVDLQTLAQGPRRRDEQADVVELAEDRAAAVHDATTILVAAVFGRAAGQTEGEIVPSRSGFQRQIPYQLEACGILVDFAFLLPGSQERREARDEGIAAIAQIRAEFQRLARRQRGRKPGAVAVVARLAAVVRPGGGTAIARVTVESFRADGTRQTVLVLVQLDAHVGPECGGQLHIAVQRHVQTPQVAV